MARPVWVPLLLLAMLTSVASLLDGCRGTPPEPSPASPESDPSNPLYVSPSSYDFSRDPALLERILERPFGYFRFINAPFASAVCRGFGDDLTSMPSVNLHGDAHLEQYMVTAEGRGLTDFDASCSGPPVIDLIRFSVSILLAAEARGWTDHRYELRDAFLDGYRSALEDPRHEAPVPAVVTRIRSGFSRDHREFLEWTDSLTEPVPEDLASATSKALAQKRMAATRPELGAGYFAIKTVGALRMGIGSALDEKYLLRIEGPSPAENDDIIVEAKEVRDLQEIDCVYRRPNDPFPILVAQSRIAYQPNRFLGFMHYAPRKARSSPLGREYWDGKTFWFFAWQDNYQELSTDTSFASPEELVEVVYDVGVQLGAGHPAGIASPHDRQLRMALLEVVGLFEHDIHGETSRLAEQTVAAWKRFREEVGAE